MHWTLAGASAITALAAGQPARRPDLETSTQPDTSRLTTRTR
jgi:hypothetical protein